MAFAAQIVSNLDLSIVTKVDGMWDLQLSALRTWVAKFTQFQLFHGWIVA